MPRFIRSSLVAGFAATIVAAGVITVAPQPVASAPRSTTARISESAVLMASSTDVVGNNCSPSECYESTGSLLLDPTTLVTYEVESQWNAGVPAGAGGGGIVVSSVSHPRGLIPQLVGIAPPIYKAIVGSKTVTLMEVAPKMIQGVAEFGGYANAAGAVVGQQMEVAMSDTFSPAQWGGGKVLQDWRNVGVALQAMTIGIGATVDGVWVPSLRIAAFSIRHQIANDIAGRTPSSIGWLPNYARDYVPTVTGNLPSYWSTTVGCKPTSAGCLDEIEAVPSVGLPAAVLSARNTARITSKSVAAAAPKATAAPKAAAARTRSAKLVSRN
jgi:hypothetical protein